MITLFSRDAYRIRFALAVSLAAFFAVAGCRRSGPTGLRGSALPDPLPKPDVTLTDVDGKPFVFREATDGKLTLLFFGYTSCPDICPMHMANIAAVLRDLPFAWQNRIRVVFVSVDPRRDTPARIKEWLANFSPAFIGVTGPTATVDGFERALYLPEAVTIPAEKPGEYTVGHAAQVIAFTEDGLARYVYPFGTRQEDWAHDLPLLLGEKPVPAPVSPAPAGAGDAAAPRLRTALVPLPPGKGPGALYAVFAPATGPERLVGLASPLGGRWELHTQERAPDGRMSMRAVTGVSVAAGQALRLVPGGHHAMFYDLPKPLAAGATVPVTFTFASAGAVTAAARVVPYDEIERLIEAAEGARP